MTEILPLEVNYLILDVLKKEMIENAPFNNKHILNIIRLMQVNKYIYQVVRQYFSKIIRPFEFGLTKRRMYCFDLYLSLIKQYTYPTLTSEYEFRITAQKFPLLQECFYIPENTNQFIKKKIAQLVKIQDSKVYFNFAVNQRVIYISLIITGNLQHSLDNYIISYVPRKFHIISFIWKKKIRYMWHPIPRI